MSELKLNVTFAPTDATLSSNGTNLIFTLGGNRTSDNAATERRWFDDQVQELQSHAPERTWNLIIDFKNIKAEQSTTVGIKTLATRILRDDKIGAIAIVRAGKGYQVIIRSIVFALTTETGKLKFFDAMDTAIEWLNVKKK